MNDNFSNKKDEAVILSMFHGMWQNRCLSVLVGLNIPEILCSSANQQPMSVEDVAKRAGCASHVQLYPIMRVLAQWGIGIEGANKHFSKNEAMEMLRKDQGPSLGTMVAYYGSDEHWASMAALPEAVKKGQPSFLLAHGMLQYEYMSEQTARPYDHTKMRVGCSQHLVGSKERRQELANIYENAMKYNTYLQLDHECFESRNILNVFPWPSCKTLMDIGGATGSFLSTVLSLPGCEHVQGILVDLPALIEKAQERFTPGCGIAEERLRLLAHDCFKPFPADFPRADTIMVKNFLEGFNTEDCVKIVANIRNICPPGSRFLVLSGRSNAEPGDTQHAIAANGLQLGFLNVHVHPVGGLQRSRSEWEAFFELVAAQARFKLSNVYETAFGGTIAFELIPV